MSDDSTSQKNAMKVAELENLNYGASTSATAPQSAPLDQYRRDKQIQDAKVITPSQYQKIRVEASVQLANSRIETVTSKQRMQAEAIQSAKLAKMKQLRMLQASVQSRVSFMQHFAGNPNSGATDVVPDAAFHALREGVMPGSTISYRNKPIIQLFAIDGTAGEAYMPPFTNFILTNVVAQDAERMDVLETFGAPHFFTTGRFVRKYSFSGLVRNYPAVDPDSKGVSMTNNEQARKLSLVSQRDLLINFYEQYMRASACAAAGRYVSITVDGHTFDGFVTELTINRDANMELVSPFSFSMLVFDRKDTSKAKDALIAYKSTKANTTTAADQSQIERATTDQKITVKAPGGGENGFGEAGCSLGTTNLQARTFSESPIIELTCTKGNDVLSIECDGGLTLVYEDGSPVDNAPSRQGTQSCRVEMSNPSALQANQQKERQSGSKNSPGFVPLKIKSNNSDAYAVLNSTFYLESGRTPVFSVVSAKLGQQNVTALYDQAEGTITFSDVQLRAGDFTGPGNTTLHFEFVLSAVDASGNTIDMTLLAPVVEQPTIVPLYNGAPAESANDKDSSAGSVTGTPTATVTAENLTVAVDIEFGGDRDLNMENFFDVADGARIQMNLPMDPNGDFSLHTPTVRLDMKMVANTRVRNLFDAASLEPGANTRPPNVLFHISKSAINAKVKDNAFELEVLRGYITVSMGGFLGLGRTQFQISANLNQNLTIPFTGYKAVVGLVRSPSFETRGSDRFYKLQLRLDSVTFQPLPGKQLPADFNESNATAKLYVALNEASYDVVLASGIHMMAK